MPATSTILLTAPSLSAARSSLELIAYREPGCSGGEDGESGGDGGGGGSVGGDGDDGGEGGDGGGEGGEGSEGGEGGGGASWWMVTSVLVHSEPQYTAHVVRPCGGEDESPEMMRAW